MVSNQYSTLISEVEKDVVGQLNIPGSQAAGQITYLQFANDPELPNVLDNYYQSPSTQKSVLFGIYVTGSLSPDGYLKFSVDDVETNIVFGKLNPTNINIFNPVQFDHAIVLLPNSKMKVKFIQDSATTTSVSQTVGLRFMVAPAGQKVIHLPKR